METLPAVDISHYIRKINQVEVMLEDIKQGLSLFNKDLQESIKRGENDLANGRMTVCKTEEDLNAFFASI